MGVLTAVIDFLGNYKVKNNYKGYQVVPHFPVEIIYRDYHPRTKLNAAITPLTSMKEELFGMHRPYQSGYVLLHDALLPVRGVSNLMFGLYHCARSLLSMLKAVVTLPFKIEYKKPRFIDKYRYLYGLATIAHGLIQLLLTPVFMPMNVFSRIAAQIQFHQSKIVVNDNEKLNFEISGSTTFFLRGKFGVGSEPLLLGSEYEKGGSNRLIRSFVEADQAINLSPVDPFARLRSDTNGIVRVP